MVDNLSIAVDVLLVRILTSLLVNYILLSRYMNWSMNFIDLQFNEEMAPSWSKH